MKGISTLFLLSLIAFSSAAQDPTPYAKTISVEDLKKHLYVIAGDDYEGRETGFSGQKKCEEYMVDFYKKIGLPPVDGSYVQEFEVDLTTPSRVRMKMGTKEFKMVEDFYYNPGTGDRTLSGNIYYAGFGIDDPEYSDVSTLNVKGKMVMVWEGEPKNKDGTFLITSGKQGSEWSSSFDKKYQMFKEAGAEALMVIRPNYADRKERLQAYFSHEGMNLAQEEGVVDMTMPLIHLSEKTAAEMLGRKAMNKAKKGLSKGKVKSIGGAELSITFSRKEQRLTTTNVMGYIEGSDLKDEVIVVSAHYDHIGVDGEEVYNGADDDGSGTVTCMEIAEAFALAKKEGNGPRRSILILNVSGEEKGLLGSQYYVENPVFPLENTVVDLNIDMIGRVDEFHPNDSNYVYLIGSDFLSDDLHNVNVEQNKKYSGLNLDMRYNSTDDPNRFYYRSDHYNFAKNNIPSVFYFTGVHDDYHKPTDTVDKIMFVKLSTIAQHIFYTAWDIANRDQRLRLNSSKR